MTTLQRQSPVQFKASAVETEIRNGWPVTLTYGGEEGGPYLVDLSHKTRWDLQSSDLAGFRPGALEIPRHPGESVYNDKVLINRMNRSQASVWHLGDLSPALPDDPAYTDVTEAAAHLALFGPRTFSITEKLTALDLLDPSRHPPFLFQGPFAHVPCQVVVFTRDGDGSGCILFTFSRGYGKDMVDAVLSAGIEFGLRPAGEKKFASKY